MRRGILVLAAAMCAAQPPGEWPSYGRDAAETNYSPLDQINTETVSRLGLAWSVGTGSPPGKVQATPVLHDGVLFTSLSLGVVIAVDARTGEILWRFDPHLSAEAPYGCCGPVNRGVAVYNGRVYIGLPDGHLAALDERTGRPEWIVQVVDPSKGENLTAAVRVFKNKVIVGSAGGDFAARGHFSAYDPETGALTWRFYVVPGDPSKPFEHPELEMAAKTWTGEWWKMGGGGSVWAGIAYDAELDLLYVGTGNGGPWDQNWRSPGGGDNLFLSSILAVRPDTGRLVWHFQTTPGDHWDYAATQPMVLTDLTIGGRRRKVILQAPKNGFFYVLDRETGEFLSAAPFAAINWATGVDAKGRPIEAPGARYGDEFVEVRPSTTGAHSWTPMAFSPRTGLAYVSGEENSVEFAHNPAFVWREGQWNTGVLRRLGPSRGFLLAWNPVAQRERWRVQDGNVGSGAGGAMATAGDLVFHGGAAYHASTGERLWETSIASRDQSASWMSYMLDGRQYVAILARGWPENTLFVFALDTDGRVPLSMREVRDMVRPYNGYLLAGLMMAVAIPVGIKVRRRLSR